MRTFTAISLDLQDLSYWLSKKNSVCYWVLCHVLDLKAWITETLYLYRSKSYFRWQISRNNRVEHFEALLHRVTPLSYSCGNSQTIQRQLDLDKYDAFYLITASGAEFEITDTLYKVHNQNPNQSLCVRNLIPYILYLHGYKHGYTKYQEDKIQAFYQKCIIKSMMTDADQFEIISWNYYI